MSERLFLNRQEAGRKLSRLLLSYRARDAVIVPLSGGSVVIGRVIARQLNAALDVVAAHKIRPDFAPEVTIGAACGDVFVRDKRFPVTETALRRMADRERSEIEPWMAFCHQYASTPAVTGRPVIIVEEGLVSGFTALAAIRALQRWQPSIVAVAAPVASRAAVERLEPEVDELVSISVEEDLREVGDLYINFDDISVEEITAVFDEFRGPYQAVAH